MLKSAFQQLVDRIEAFAESSDHAALDADTRMELAADTSKLLRQVSGDVDSATYLEAAQGIVNKYDIP